MIRLHPTVWIFALMTSISVASTLSVPQQSNPPEQNNAKGGGQNLAHRRF
jgi:hypothetical protein